ncbi:hypothetical protein F383_30917 [Gossypium arboreum]|uniref:Uncharacterized protein n=1 Tax=Gossypium arboreum TaxID=29729 RepID=A0A0B0PN97_GOSAR|nr:hypothetical protein F383_30917 [Gossypium arboreum]
MNCASKWIKPVNPSCPTPATVSGTGCYNMCLYA